MKERVLGIVSNIMKWPLKKINEDSSPEDIDTWDSLNQINLVLALEEEFDVRFTDDQIVQMLSVRSIIETLESTVQ
ncbi:MAG: acyl carrier protein [Candidatus Scalindua sp.]